MTQLQVRAAAGADDIAAAYELAARAFGPNYHEARAAKDRILALEPPTDPRDLIVAIAGSEVVGLVRIVDRCAELGCGPAQIGGITSVAVRPDMRGTGCGRRLMEAALERSRERGDVLSVAYARRAVDGFYWRLGYVGLGAHVSTRYVARSEPSRGAVVPGLRPEWTAAYAAAYDHTYAGQTLRFARNDEWWNSLRARSPWLEEASFLNVLDGDVPVGYYVTSAGVIIEAASAAGKLPTLVAAVLNHAQENGHLVTLTLSPAHPASAALAALNHTTTIRRAWDGGHIVRALDRERILSLLGGRMSAAERATWASSDLRSDASARAVLMAAAAGSLAMPPVWSVLDEF